MQNEKLKGATFGLLAAVLFGASAPIAKSLLAELPPVLLAGLLYTGAALGVWGYRIATPRTSEAPLRRADAPTLTVIAVTGGLVAPVSMLYGLKQVPAFAGSLLLTLEAPFTVGLAVLLFGEHLGRRGTFALLAITLGAALLSAGPSPAQNATHGMSSSLAGGLMIAGACMCWALDNNLTQNVHDVHHQHAHEPGTANEPHSHEHTHEALLHDHPHMPDIHHRHRH